MAPLSDCVQGRTGPRGIGALLTVQPIDANAALEVCVCFVCALFVPRAYMSGLAHRRAVCDNRCSLLCRCAAGGKLPRTGGSGVGSVLFGFFGAIRFLQQARGMRDGRTSCGRSERFGKEMPHLKCPLETHLLVPPPTAPRTPVQLTKIKSCTI